LGKGLNSNSHSGARESQRRRERKKNRKASFFTVRAQPHNEMATKKSRVHWMGTRQEKRGERSLGKEKKGRRKPFLPNEGEVKREAAWDEKASFQDGGGTGRREKTKRE